MVLRNFVNLYFSNTNNPAVKMIKKIPMKQIKYILTLDGFKAAKGDVDTVSNYLVNMNDDSDKNDAQSTRSSASFSIANSIFKEN